MRDAPGKTSAGRAPSLAHLTGAVFACIIKPNKKAKCHLEIRTLNPEKGNRKRWTRSRATAMELGYVYIGWFAIGAAEWFLALARTVACIQRRPALVCGIVFIENLVGLLVLSIFIRENDWVIALAYSAGAALGSVLPLIHMKEVRKSPAAAGYR